MELTNSGRLGIGNSAPGYALDVTGDVNCSGAFRVGGVALATGGGPTTQTVVSRALATVYQNATGKPMYVSAQIGINATSSTVQAKTDGANPPTTVVSEFANSTVTNWTTLFFIVLPGNYYSVSFQAGSGSVIAWIEWS
jgi:hypothetical protein